MFLRRNPKILLAFVFILLICGPQSRSQLHLDIYCFQLAVIHAYAYAINN
jgi:hypothetical protein